MSLMLFPTSLLTSRRAGDGATRPCECGAAPSHARPSVTAKTVRISEPRKGVTRRRGQSGARHHENHITGLESPDVPRVLVQDHDRRVAACERNGEHAIIRGPLAIPVRAAHVAYPPERPTRFECLERAGEC